MTSRNLARRLERLENRLMPAKEKPIVVLITAVSADGQTGDRFRFTSAGLQRLTPAADRGAPEETRNGR